jgi:hypothetical protein
MLLLGFIALSEGSPVHDGAVFPTRQAALPGSGPDPGPSARPTHSRQTRSWGRADRRTAGRPWCRRAPDRPAPVPAPVRSPGTPSAWGPPDKASLTAGGEVGVDGEARPGRGPGGKRWHPHSQSSRGVRDGAGGRCGRVVRRIRRGSHWRRQARRRSADLPEADQDGCVGIPRPGHRAPQAPPRAPGDSSARSAGRPPQSGLGAPQGWTGHRKSAAPFRATVTSPAPSAANTASSEVSR